MGWLNSDYAYARLIAGTCHTPEEAHRVLTESLESRKMAIRECELGTRRRDNKLKKLERKLAGCKDELQREEIALKLEKLNIHDSVERTNYAYAVHEVETLTELLARLEPHCNWKNDPSISREEGYQLAQRNERKLVLLERANVGLLSTGAIDSETLREARSHPDAEELEASFVALFASMREGTLRLTSLHPTALLLEDKNA